MKIRLEAFGKLYSEPMDVPENTSPIFKMVLTQPIQAISGFTGDKIGEIPPLGTVAEFEYIGKNYHINDEFVKIYVLRDIYKR